MTAWLKGQLIKHIFSLSMINEKSKSKINLTYLLLGLGFFSLVIVVAGVTFSKILFTETTGQVSQVEGLHEVVRNRESVDPLVTLASTAPEVNKSDPVMGPKSAEVTIINYSSFDCGYCGAAGDVLSELIELYPGKVRVVWKDAPDNDQGGAYQAAIAARCAQDQGKFWEMHDLLFQNQLDFTSENFSRLASQLGLDLEKFDRCVNNKETAPYVDAAIKESDSLGILQVPYYFVNDMEFVGFGTLDDFKVLVDYELGYDQIENL